MVMAFYCSILARIRQNATINQEHRFTADGRFCLKYVKVAVAVALSRGPHRLKTFKFQ